MMLMERRRALMGGRYKKLPYLEGDGTLYVNTGYIPNQNTKIVLDYMSLKESGESFNCPIGVVSDTGTGTAGKSFFFYIGSSLGVTVSVSNNSNTATPALTVDKDSRKTFSLSVSDFSADSVSYGIPYTKTPLTASVGFPFYVFARNHGNTLARAIAKGRVYELSIFESNVLAKHFIPCMNTITGKRGMLETLQNNFIETQVVT